MTLDQMKCTRMKYHSPLRHKHCSYSRRHTEPTASSPRGRVINSFLPPTVRLTAKQEHLHMCEITSSASLHRHVQYVIQHYMYNPSDKCAILYIRHVYLTSSCTHHTSWTYITTAVHITSLA